MITTLTGSNSYLLAQQQASRLADFVAAHGDMAVERLDGAETSVERVSEALHSLPFLSDRKLVVLRSPSANKQFLEQFPELFAAVSDTTEVLIVEPKLDKRSSYYKFLKKSTDFQECTPLDAGGLARWLSQTAAASGGTLSSADAHYLVSRLGLNQQTLAAELDKLLLYAPQVSRQAINAMTEATPQSTIFELLDAAFSGNAARTAALYAEQRALKVEPQQIVAMIAWQLHILALITVAAGRAPDAIAAQAKVSPYVVKKSLSIARRLTKSQLTKLLGDLMQLDARAKRQAYNLDEALQTYLLGIATA